MTTPLPTGADYENTRAYGARGWCVVERRLSSLVKDYRCMWDVAAWREARPRRPTTRWDGPR